MIPMHTLTILGGILYLLLLLHIAWWDISTASKLMWKKRGDDE